MAKNGIWIFTIKEKIDILTLLQESWKKWPNLMSIVENIFEKYFQSANSGHHRLFSVPPPPKFF